MSDKKFRGITMVFDEMLPDRDYDLTNAISEGLREVSESKRNNPSRKKNPKSFIDEL